MRENPLIVSYGGGRNSTAMLIAMGHKGIKPDAILFADTGGELPETYEFIKIFSEFIRDQFSFPPIEFVRKRSLVKFKERSSILVRRVNNNPRSLLYWYIDVMLTVIQNDRQEWTYESLEEKCFVLKTLPSKTFGRSECSLTWKIEPMDVWVKDHYPKQKVIRVIGYHAGEIERKNRGNKESELYEYWYPLIEWGIYQAHCEALIQSTGLPVPPKSSCFFCPNRRALEVLELKQNHPDLYQRGVDLENNANLKEDSAVKGLGRRFKWSEVDKLTPLEKILNQHNLPDCHCID